MVWLGWFEDLKDWVLRVKNCWSRLFDALRDVLQCGEEWEGQIRGQEVEGRDPL